MMLLLASALLAGASALPEMLPSWVADGIWTATNGECDDFQCPCVDVVSIANANYTEAKDDAANNFISAKWKAAGLTVPSKVGIFREWSEQGDQFITQLTYNGEIRGANPYLRFGSVSPDRCVLPVYWKMTNPFISNCQEHQFIVSSRPGCDTSMYRDDKYLNWALGDEEYDTDVCAGTGATEPAKSLMGRLQSACGFGVKDGKLAMDAGKCNAECEGVMADLKDHEHAVTYARVVPSDKRGGCIAAYDDDLYFGLYTQTCQKAVPARSERCHQLDAMFYYNQCSLFPQTQAECDACGGIKDTRKKEDCDRPHEFAVCKAGDPNAAVGTPTPTLVAAVTVALAAVFA